LNINRQTGSEDCCLGHLNPAAALTKNSDSHPVAPELHRRTWVPDQNMWDKTAKLILFDGLSYFALADAGQFHLPLLLRVLTAVEQ